MRFTIAIGIVFGIGLVVDVPHTSARSASLEQSDDLRTLNRTMTELFQKHPAPRGEKYWSTIIEPGTSGLRSQGITVFMSYMQVVEAPAVLSMREFVFQEWLRNFQEGMPWLPLSWGYGNYPLYRYNEYMPRFEAALNSMRFPLSDENLLLLNYFNASVPHANTKDWATVVRKQALLILDYDPKFHDLRLEVHEAPSALTIRKLEKYLTTVTNDRVEKMIRELIEQLESLFGAGALNHYLSVYQLTSSEREPFNQCLQAVNELANANSAQALSTLIDNNSLHKALKTISTRATSISQALRNGQSVGHCVFDNQINCTFEVADYLRQLNQSAFSLSNQLIGKLREYSVELSFQDFLKISEPLIEVAVAQGYNASELLKRIRELSALSGKLTRDQMIGFLSELETGLQNLIADFRGQFLADISRFRAFTDSVEIFVDDNIRSTTVLPFGNLLSAVKRTLTANSGIRFYLGEDPVAGSLFQVMNPGIAHGTLVIPTAEELVDPKYRWNPESIYFLEKTPNSLQKVAGIMTGSAGSMISHVQLLASNHGLPNVYIGAKIKEKVKTWAGKDVLLISLPNGEAVLRLWKDASEAEKKTYNDYYKIKEKKKIRIAIPADLEKYNYPIQLELLRMSDAGKVAGGKATGQAEVSSIPGLGKMVPKGIVLPFGVYYQHMKETGIYERIQRVFTSPMLAGDRPEAFEARRKELETIRNLIYGIELMPAISETITKILLDRPYRDDFETYGVFVRSDTNAEDLPGFVGAGLNKTIGNVKNLRDVFDAIKFVWASPFDERAFTWRNDLIENPWDILPSVVIQIGMPADKAGVMIVGSPMVPEDIQDTIYIAANEGLGFTTVGGEYSAEEISVSRLNQYSYNRLKKSYAPTMYVFRNEGTNLKSDAEKKFLNSVPVKGLSPILPPEEAKALAQAGDKIQKHIAQKYGVMGKWDIEWCFVGGKPIIVQLRAFNGNKIARDVSSLGKLQKKKSNDGFSAEVNERFIVLSKEESQ